MIRIQFSNRSHIRRDTHFFQPSRLVFSRNTAQSAAKQHWYQQVTHLPPELQPVVKTFGELVMQDSGAIPFTPRYPQRIEDVQRYPLPSNPAQMALSGNLARRLTKLGLQVKQDRHYNVIGRLPSNLPPNFPNRHRVPVLGFTAHLDTTYEQPNEGVIPQLHVSYKGGNITISKQNSKGEQVVLEPESSPILKKKQGHDVITTSGDTLLGADAKAGVAEILEALRMIREHNRKNPTTPIYYPEIRVAFVVDEETNLLGARTINLQDFGAEYAIDLDDTEPGIINYRSYNGDNISFKIKARSVHPAEAEFMRTANPYSVASDIFAALPKNQRYENKRGKMNGYILAEQAQVNWHGAEGLILARDVTQDGLQRRVSRTLKSIQEVAKDLKGRPAELAWRVEEEYRDYGLKGDSPFVRHMVQSAKAVGLQPELKTFRGCTDASIWNDRGLPTVNLGSGWYNAHQLTEFTTAQDLYAVSRYLVKTIADWPLKGPKRPAKHQPPQFKPLGWPRIYTSPNWW